MIKMQFNVNIAVKSLSQGAYTTSKPANAVRSLLTAGTNICEGATQTQPKRIS